MCSPLSLPTYIVHKSRRFADPNVRLEKVNEKNVQRKVDLRNPISDRTSATTFQRRLGLWLSRDDSFIFPSEILPLGTPI